MGHFLAKNKKFLFVTCLAIMVGFLYLFYDLLLFYWYGQSGQIYLAALPGTEGYVSTIWPRLREIVDGYLRVADFNIWEYREGPASLHPVITPFLYLPIFIFAGLRFTMPIGNFIFAAACFLLLYKIFRLLTDKAYLSASVAAILVMARDLPTLLLPHSLNQFKDLVKVFLPFFPMIDGRLNFLSMEAVMPGFMIFGPFFIFLLLTLKTGRGRYFILLGIFYGLLFYTYTFYWIYGTLVLGLAASWHFLIKKYKDSFKFAGAWFLGAALSSYFWFTYFTARALPNFKNYIARVGGIEEGHAFRFSQWPWYVIYFAFSCLVCIYAHKIKKYYLAKFIGLLFAAGFISLNFQLVTGLNIQPDHWYLRVMRFPLAFVFVILIDWLYSVLKNFKLQKMLTTLLAVLVTLVLIGGGHTAYAKAKKRFNEFSLPVGIYESVEWINKNIPKDSVILTPDLYMNDLFLYYTSSRTFIPRAIISFADEPEMLDRLFAVYKLFNISEDYLVRELNPKRLEEMKPASLDVSLFDYIYQATFYNRSFDAYLRGDIDRPIPLEKISEVAEKYRNYNFDLMPPTFKHRADYIYVGPLERKISIPDLNLFDNLFFKVYESGEAVIYKIQ